MKLGLLGRIALGLMTIPAISNGEQMTVRVADFVGLSKTTRDELRANATRILGNAGIAVDLIDCLTGGSETGAAGCNDPLGPTDFVLRIFEPKLAMHAEQLGYAALTPKGGAYATVFLDPNRREERVAGLTDGTLLGHAAAHEIGHLLLGANSHSRFGIMRPYFGPSDQTRMAQGQSLSFSKDQAGRMRAALAARAVSGDYSPRNAVTAFTNSGHLSPITGP